MANPHSRRTFRLEELEPRLTLSQVLGPPHSHDHAPHRHHHASHADDHRLHRGQHAQTDPPPIDLSLIALHEFGHSLGLDHIDDPSSIMYKWYDPAYNPDHLADDPATAELRTLYADVTASPWKDPLDPTPGNNVVDVTYSFIPDDTRLDRKKLSTTFATMNAIFGSPDAWQPIFTDALDRWAAVSDGRLNFISHADTGLRFAYAGASQNDPDAGDIRIATHKFKGPGKTLAHTYFPPPNGSTAAGDAHFDHAENWVHASDVGALLSATSTMSGPVRRRIFRTPH